MKIKLDLETRGRIPAKTWPFLERAYGADAEVELNELTKLPPNLFIELIISLRLDIDEDMAIEIVETLVPILESEESLAAVSIKTLEAIELFRKDGITEQEMLKNYYDARDAVATADKNKIHFKAISALCYAAGSLYVSLDQHKYSLMSQAISLASEVALIKPDLVKQQTEIIQRYFKA